MRLGLGLSLTGTRRQAWSPAALFASGEAGAWYDIAPEYCFTTSTGTTQAGVGDPVGLLLDRSKGLVIGPELVTAGWTADAGWSQDGQTFTAANVTINTGVRLAGLGTAGKWYRADVTWSGANNFWRFYGDRFTTLLDISTGSGSATVHWLSTGGTTELRGLNGAQSGTFTISVRELPGNHATQATSAARPTLRAVYDGVGALGPELVTNGTFDTDTTGWTAHNAAVLTVVDGKINVNSTVPYGEAYQIISVDAGKLYVATVNIYKNGVDDVRFRISGGGVTNNHLLPNEPSAEGASTFYFHTGAYTSIAVRLTHSSTTTDAQFDNVSVREVPEASRLYYLEFDGVDDFLQVTTPAFGLVNLSVWLAASQDVDVNNAGLLVFDTASGLDFAETTALAIETGAASHHFAAVGSTSTTFVLRASGAGATPLAVYEMHKTAAAGEVFVDGVSADTDNSFTAFAATHTGNLRIGTRGAGTVSIPLNGNIYSVLFRCAETATPERLLARQYVAARSGVTL